MAVWLVLALAVASPLDWTSPSCTSVPATANGRWSATEWFDRLDAGDFPRDLAPLKWTRNGAIEPHGPWVAEGRRLPYRLAEHALARNGHSQKRYRRYREASEQLRDARREHRSVSTVNDARYNLDSSAKMAAQAGIDPDGPVGKFLGVSRYLNAATDLERAERSVPLHFHVAVCEYNGGPVLEPAQQPAISSDRSTLLEPPPRDLDSK